MAESTVVTFLRNAEKSQSVSEYGTGPILQHFVIQHFRVHQYGTVMQSWENHVWLQTICDAADKRTMDGTMRTKDFGDMRL